MRRYWEVDLDILTEINPEFTVFTLYDNVGDTVFLIDSNLLIISFSTK